MKEFLIVEVETGARKHDTHEAIMKDVVYDIFAVHKGLEAMSYGGRDLPVRFNIRVYRTDALQIRG